MNRKSSAHYQREYRKRLRDQGLVKKEVWIRPEHSTQLTAIEGQLRQLPQEQLSDTQNPPLAAPPITWNTASLFAALINEPLFAQGRARIELIEGLDPALYLEMHEFGDLPVFVTVSGAQILVESCLWPVSEVINVPEFNQVVLQSHKYFPLSTISIDHLGELGDYYQMVGALSSTSLLGNVLLEIEILASNVMQAVEAYGSYLKTPVTSA